MWLRLFPAKLTKCTLFVLCFICTPGGQFGRFLEFARINFHEINYL